MRPSFGSSNGASFIVTFVTFNPLFCMRTLRPLMVISIPINWFRVVSSATVTQPSLDVTWMHLIFSASICGSRLSKTSSSVILPTGGSWRQRVNGLFSPGMASLRIYQLDEGQVVWTVNSPRASVYHTFLINSDRGLLATFCKIFWSKVCLFY